MNTAVAILNWNGIAFLKKFLPGVVKNSAGARVVVIDNNSSDLSINYVSETFPEVQIIALSENFGFSEGYNQGIRQIEEELIVLLNSDVEVTEGWLLPLESAMMADSNLAACQPKILSYSDKTSFEYAGAAGGLIDMFGYPFCQGRVLNVLEKDSGQYDRETSIFWATGACMMVRKQFYLEAGGLDSDFFAHMEEIDLCWRFHHLKWKLKYIPGSKVYHVGGGTLEAGNLRKTYLNFRNNLLLLVKNLPSNQLFPTLLIRLVLDGFAGILFLSKGSLKEVGAVLNAHLFLYRNFGKFRKKKLENLSRLRHIPGVFHGLLPVEFYLKGKKISSEILPSNPK